MSRIWDISSRTGISICEDENRYYNAEFSDDGSLAFFFGLDKEGKEVIRALNLEKTKAIDLPRLAAEPDILSLSPDAKKLLIYNASNNENPIMIWDILSNESIALSKPDDLSFSNLFFNPSGDKILGYDDISRRIKVYDLNALDTIPLKNSSGYDYFDFSDTGDKLLAYDNNGEHPPVVWDFKTHQKLRLPGSIQSFRKAKFSPDNTKIIAYHDSIIDHRATRMTLWDLVTGNTISLEDNNNNFDFVEFSSNGRWLLAYDLMETGIFRLWDIATAKQIDIGKNLTGITDVYLSEDGSKLKVNDNLNSMLLVWDLTSTQPRIVLNIDNFNYTFTEFTPDSKKIIGMPLPGSGIKIWNIETGETVESNVITGEVSEYSFISDNYLLFEYEDGTKNIFDLTNGNISELRSLKGKQFLGTYCVPEENKMTIISNSGHVKTFTTNPDSLLNEIYSRKGGVWKLDKATKAKYGLSSKD